MGPREHDPGSVVLMIGTDTFGRHGDTPDDVVRGIAAIVRTLRKKLPSTKILLPGNFPRDEPPGTGFRKSILTVNAEIAPDFLPFSEKGCRTWADAVAPLLNSMTGK